MEVSVMESVGAILKRMVESDPALGGLVETADAGVMREPPPDGDKDGHRIGCITPPDFDE